MTSSLKSYPSRVLVKSGGQTGMVTLDQIKTVDKSRIIKIFNSISQTEIIEIRRTIKELYVE
jgi:mRNA interferase MazF